MFIFTIHSISAMCQELQYTFHMHHFKILSSQTLTSAVALAAISRCRNWFFIGCPQEIMFIQACTTPLCCEGVNTGGTAHEQQGIRTAGYRFHSFVICLISSKMYWIRLFIIYCCDQTSVTHSSSELRNAFLYWLSSLFHIPVLYFCFMHASAFQFLPLREPESGTVLNILK